MAGISNDETQERSFDTTLMARLLKFARPYWWMLLISLVLICILTAKTIACPLIVRQAIDNYIDPTTARFVRVDALEDVQTANGVVGGVDRFVLGGHSYYDSTELTKGLRLSGKSVQTTDVSLYVVAPDKARQLGIDRLNGYVDAPQPFVFSAPQPVFPEGTYIMDALSLQRFSPEEHAWLRSVDVAGIKRLSLLFLAIVLLAFVVGYINRVLLEVVGQRIVYDIRVQLFEHVERLPFSFFDRTPSGRLTTRVTNDIEALADMYSQALINIVRDGFLLVGVTVVMFSLNAFLTWVLMAVLTAVVILTAVFRVSIRNAHRVARTCLSRINSFIAERIQGVRVVQLFAIEEKEKKKFQKINESYTLARLHLMLLNGVFRPLVGALATFAVALLLYYGGGHILAGALSFGTLVTFTFYTQIFFQPVQEVAEQFDTIQQAMASAEKIFHIVDEPQEEYVPETFAGVVPHEFSIEFQDVHLSYTPGQEILKGISFNVEQGGSVALVGATGAGKTSITGLVPRFYGIDSGRVLLGGVDVATLPAEFLRQSVAFVMQDVFIFSGTILHNIALFDEHPDEEKAAEIVDYLGMRFMKGLEGGLHHHLYERGNNLSSGERQLISFARALYFDPKVLILDEATSDIDTESEAVIQAAIRKILKGRTSIIVAHRLSTIRTVDRILVVQKGQISESGTHEELLETGGIYKNLYELQSLSEEET
ncbi:ABC transporter ATP-binding protein [Candidatus Cryosericum hinesii]|jgi:ABC-type multidrug transport system fused ATPase/permease subunit|uniref:ABC transporter ATP-binding protein n=3 Tax=Candidatus Cryosericum hinesii TaxID=2290915 RepID=A0ABX9MGK7_9BACT|nr:ABC transporter ATP-binding protein [Candidatus Cryosericum hinesii]RIE07983.1 ABC transporter ATP-binding protein [Candidatus Cryosericum hinesii]RIE14376.1 ABC transporter ATP-binding protein [Candidatus Cryosericum hinesii]